MKFQIPGLTALILFYGVYIGKMLKQKRKGIQTDQMAKGGKKGSLFWTELWLKTATYLVVLVEGISVAGNFSLLPELLRWLGTGIAYLGVMIFGISVYTMRDSWRAGISPSDKTMFVTDGIYGRSRNPAFLGFDLTYAGLLLMFFNPLLLLCSCFAAMMLHLQILQEEKFLAETFGAEYTEYKKRVKRYWGKRKIPEKTQTPDRQP